jgi:TatA/E family protein of Tat protein translocase
MGDIFANPLHLVILLVVVLIIFGPGKLPGVGAALGKSVREFKKASTEDDTTSAARPSPSYLAAPTPAGSAAVAGAPCPECGHENQAGARFCSSCGATIVTPAETVAESEPQAAPAAPVAAVCPDCQTENPPSSRFCAHCGKLLDEPAKPVQAQSV